MFMLKWITPNQLTIGRILVIPVILALLYLNDPFWNHFSLGLFFVACLTDYWDGYLARFRGEVSPAGKLLDPIADKMLISSCLVMLTHLDQAQVVPTVVILMREFAVSGLRQVAAAEGIVIAAVSGAQVKTVLQMLAVGFLLFAINPYSLPTLEVGQVMLWVALGWTLWTGYRYFRAYFNLL